MGYERGIGAMKKAPIYVALLGIVVLASCSGDSPSPPAVPTPVSTTWAITALSVSSGTAYVGSGVVVTATVTKDGSQAPDGTTVEFAADGGLFLSSAGTSASVATSGGRAVAVFGVTENTGGAGTYTIQARVATVTRQTTVTFTEPDSTDALLIYSIIPTEGGLAGGEQVVLAGNGIVTPVEVTFTVGGTEYPARVMDVVPSDSPGSITVETPRVTNVDQTVDSPATVTVKVGVGTSKEQSQTLVNAFTFLKEIFVPVIYGVYPDQGSARGGEQVTILGANLTGVTKVTFDDREASNVTESADGHQVTVVTPSYGATPLQENVAVAVKVETPGGTANKDDAFIFKADEPQPFIKGIAPAAGPLDGGTRVTIFGSGFQFPAQVFFIAGGVSKEANVINVSDDTSAADDDEIVCVSPDFSDIDQTTPFAADVRVLNVNTGRDGTGTGIYTYGDRLFVSGNTPAEGGEGTEVTIFGAGFVSPLQVDYLGFSSPLRVDTTSISGSQMVVRMPAPTTPSCTAVTGGFRVRLLESPNNPVEGGSFTYYGNTPTIESITPSSVSEIADGVGVDPSSAVIMGKNFADSVRVEFDGVPLLSSAFQVISETEIDVTQLPAPNDLGLTFDTVACVDGSGVPGRRQVPTPVNVTVTNTNANCSDTLTNGITYEPQNTDCVVSPNIVLQPAAGSTLTLPATPAGSCSTFQQVTVRNTGGAALDWTAAINGPFSFTGTAGDINRGGTVAPGTSTALEVYFCPTVDDNTNQFGQIQFLSNDPDNNPVFLNLQGQEAAGQMVLPNLVSWTGSEGAGAGSCSPAKAVTITNTGLDDLNYGATLSGRFYFDSGASNQGPVQGVVSASSSVDVDVYFCPGIGATGTLDGTMTVTSDDPNNQSDTVDLQGDVIVADIGVQPPSLDFTANPVPAGSCSAMGNELPVTISNSGFLTLSYTIAVSGPFYLDSAGTSQADSGSIAYQGAAHDHYVWFCPSVDDNGQQTGTFTVTSNDPVDPTVDVSLTGQEAP